MIETIIAPLIGNCSFQDAMITPFLQNLNFEAVSNQVFLWFVKKLVLKNHRLINSKLSVNSSHIFLILQSQKKLKISHKFQLMSNYI